MSIAGQVASYVLLIIHSLIKLKSLYNYKLLLYALLEFLYANYQYVAMYSAVCSLVCSHNL